MQPGQAPPTMAMAVRTLQGGSVVVIEVANLEKSPFHQKTASTGWSDPGQEMYIYFFSALAIDYHGILLS